MENSIENFLISCDDFINCKYLVAEYKLQKMLKALAGAEDVCTLVGDCLEQFNRDREFSKAYIQDGHGDFMCDMPEEEYKIIALVFCTLVDIDNKKIDFTDFVKRFFGRDENPFQSFIKTMVIPFRNLIAEAFGYEKISSGEEESSDVNSEENQEEVQDKDEEIENQEVEENQEDDENDIFQQIEKLAVQILTELQFAKQDKDVESVERICKSIVKTSSMKDEDITLSLAESLKFYKVKQIKFYVKEILSLID